MGVSSVSVPGPDPVRILIPSPFPSGSSGSLPTRFPSQPVSRPIESIEFPVPSASLAVASHSLGFGESLGELLVLGLHLAGEAEIGDGVLVRAVDLGVGGQRCDPRDRAVHLLHGPLEDAAAAACEEGVSDEGEAVADVAHMARRVAAQVDHGEIEIDGLEADAVAVGHVVVDPCDAFGGWAVDGRTVAIDDLAQAAHVVAVAVGHEHGAGVEIARVELLDHRSGISWIDQHNPSGSLALKDPHVVVGQRGDRDQLDHGSMLAARRDGVNRQPSRARNTGARASVAWGEVDE